MVSPEALKRRRSQPSEWWKSNNDDDAVSAETSTPREPRRDPARKTKRGAPSDIAAPAADGKSDGPRRKRRKAGTADAGEGAAAAAAAASEVVPRKRGRPPKMAGSSRASQADGGAAELSRRFTGQGASGNTMRRGVAPTLSKAASSNKETSSSKATSSNKTSSNQAPPARQRSNKTTTAVIPSPAEAGQRNAKPTPEEPRKRKQKAVAEPTPKRQRIEEAARQPTESPEPKLPAYQHLAAVTRNVSHKTIDAEWSALPSTAIPHISAIITAAQRPVTARVGDDTTRRLQVTTALGTIARRIVGKIGKGLPFPPPTVIKHRGRTRGPNRNAHIDADFDFEKIIQRNRALEALLTPAQHANALLAAELDREEAALDADRLALADLEQNARAATIQHARNARKAHHPLLRPDTAAIATTNPLNDLKHSIGLHLPDDPHDTAPSPLDALARTHTPAPTPAITALLTSSASGLMSHLQSMRSNAAQLDGLAHALTAGRAAVQTRLLPRVDRLVYEDVVLG